MGQKSQQAVLFVKSRFKIRRAEFYHVVNTQIKTKIQH